MPVRRGDAARRRLLGELRRAEEHGKDLAGKVRIIVKDDAADVWDVQLFFRDDSGLGSELAEHARRTGCPEHVLLELRFPPLFPADPPALRAVRPRLCAPRQSDVAADAGIGHPPSPVGLTNGLCDQLRLTPGGVLQLPDLAPGKWSPHMDLSTFLLRVHSQLLTCGVGLDTASTRAYSDVPDAELALGATGQLSTVARCMTQLQVARLESAAEVFPELALVPPGRVVLPQETAREIYARAFSSGSPSGQGPVAVHVEIKNLATGGRAYAGLADTFAPQDSAVFAPSWMLRQLFLRDGDEVRVRLVNLPMCSFVRLQPSCREFYDRVGTDARSVLQVALAPLPALTAGLAVPVEMPSTGSSGAVVRQMMVLVARLEDESGNEVLAAKMPAHAGMLGDHEVRVDFLPAADLEESGREYKERCLQDADEADRVLRLAAAKRARWRVEQEEAVAASAVRPTPEQIARLGDGTSGHELCFRLPNGKQLRRRFAGDLSVADLKTFLLSLRETSDAVWQPSPSTEAGELDLATAFPRRALADADSVDSIGNRAVLQVNERQAIQVPVDDNAAASAGVDAVLYPQELCAEVASAPMRDVDAHLASEWPIEAIGHESDSTIRGTDDAELRAMALSLGVRHEDVARAVDEEDLVALVAEAQADPMVWPPSRGSGSSRPGAPTLSAVRGALPSDEQLASVGLSVSQYLELPDDTRDAILVAMGCGIGGPCSERAATSSSRSTTRPTSSGVSAPSSVASVARSASSASSSLRSPAVSPQSGLGGRFRPPSSSASDVPPVVQRSSSARVRPAYQARGTADQPPRMSSARRVSPSASPRSSGLAAGGATTNPSLSHVAGAAVPLAARRASSETPTAFRSDTPPEADPVGSRRPRGDSSRMPPTAPRRPIASNGGSPPAISSAAQPRMRSRSGDSQLRSAGRLVVCGEDTPVAPSQPSSDNVSPVLSSATGRCGGVPPMPKATNRNAGRNNSASSASNRGSARLPRSGSSGLQSAEQENVSLPPARRHGAVGAVAAVPARFSGANRSASAGMRLARASSHDLTH